MQQSFATGDTGAPKAEGRPDPAGADGARGRALATELLPGHVKDEFYRGRVWETFEDFKRDLEEYIVHWNTSRRQVRLKGLTPEEFRNQSPCAA